MTPPTKPNCDHGNGGTEDGGRTEAHKQSAAAVRDVKYLHQGRHRPRRRRASPSYNAQSDATNRFAPTRSRSSGRNVLGASDESSSAPAVVPTRSKNSALDDVESAPSGGVTSSRSTNEQRTKRRFYAFKGAPRVVSTLSTTSGTHPEFPLALTTSSSVPTIRRAVVQSGQPEEPVAAMPNSSRSRPIPRPKGFARNLQHKASIAKQWLSFGDTTGRTRGANRALPWSCFQEESNAISKTRSWHITLQMIRVGGAATWCMKREVMGRVYQNSHALMLTPVTIGGHITTTSAMLLR